ncbi:hypothetical protein ACMYYO_12420 [Dermacoccaceae bacterium W4C1]
MGGFVSALLGVVGVLIVVGAAAGGGWLLVRRGRYTGSGSTLFLGWALIAIGAWGAAAALWALIQQLT